MQPTDEPTSSPAPAWKQRLLASRLFVTVHDERRFVLNVERFVIFGGLVTFLIGILATAAASTGTFRFIAPLLILFALGVLAVLGWGFFTRNVILRGDRFDAIAILMVLASIALAGFLNHQAYFGTTDTGFYANDAIQIANTGGRTFDRPGDALLPGMEPAPGGGVSYAAMFGYSSFIALFYWIAGLEALAWANTPFLLLAHLGLYTVGRQLRARSGAVVGLAFYSTSLITVWLERYAMTELAATAVFWVTAVLVVPLVHKWDASRAAAAFVGLTYGAVVRPEGFLVIGWTGLLLVFRWRRPLQENLGRLRNYIRTHRTTQFAAGGAVILAILAAVQARSSLPVGYLQRATGFALILLQGRPAPDAHDVPTTGPGPNWGDYALRYVWDSWLAYHLPWFLLVLVAALVLRLVPRRRLAWLLALAVPYALFLFMPPVTLQQPWFMRRYWIALVPLVYVSFGVALDFRLASWRWPTRRKNRSRPRWDGGIVASLIALILAVPHLDVVSPVMLQHEEDGSIEVPEALDGLLPPEALIILDENAAGFATLLRVQHGYHVVGWKARAIQHFEFALQESKGRPTFLVHLTSARDTDLQTDPTGGSKRASLTLVNEGIPSTPLRFYLADPPLREGYLPMERYLEGVVPPDDWSSREIEWAVDELVSPVVLQKNVHFGSGWKRGAQGLESMRGEISVDQTLFPPGTLATTNLTLTVAYHQTATHATQVWAREASSEITVGLLPSDGSGSLRIEVLALPAGLAPVAFVIQNETVVRGAYMDLA